MMEQNEWKLGNTSLWFESQGRGPGTVSSGVGDHGGRSYGTYQLSSSVGTLADYVRTSSYGSRFKDMKVNSSSFIDTWKTIAAEDPAFGADQHEYIERTHYQPLMKGLTRAGVDVHARGPAVQDMVWSTSVQYGGGSRGANVVIRGLRETHGEAYRLDDLTDAQIVTAVQDSKLRHVLTDFRNSMPNTPGIESRIVTEKHALVALADTGMPMSHAEIIALHREISPLRIGSSGERVAVLQEELADLGFHSKSGKFIEADGDFGKSTEEALKDFQSSNGLYPHGQASPLTQERIGAQITSRDLGMESLRNEAQPSLTCRVDGRAHDDGDDQLRMLVRRVGAEEPGSSGIGRGASAVYDAVRFKGASNSSESILRLNDSRHPDHEFFQHVRGHVVELDKTLGRAPDHYTDNIASALAVQARADGMDRIDQIALSKDGSALWARQTPPGRTDHIFDLQTKVPTADATTPLDQTAAKWPDAMEQFRAYEQEQVLIQQRSQERAQAESQSRTVSGPSMLR
jgi:peptidoglycan hydrolase-like protein with peptidoglycan-binding domain